MTDVFLGLIAIMLGACAGFLYSIADSLHYIIRSMAKIAKDKP